jgi:hypothetical protein
VTGDLAQASRGQRASDGEPRRRCRTSEGRRRELKAEAWASDADADEASWRLTGWCGDGLVPGGCELGLELEEAVGLFWPTKDGTY